MKISIIISILLSLNFGVFQPELILEKELDYKADFITVDQLGYLYIINGSKLKKLDLENNLEKNYSNTLHGRINLIDASDPFKTLIFYKEFNKIEFLSKNFSSIASPIQLDDLGYYNVLSACQSVSGGFWIFDQSLCQLVYVDKNRNAVRKSSQLSDLVGQNIEQKQFSMLEKNDYIYLGISGEGVLLFDTYGTYIKTFPLLNIDVFQINNGIISYYYKGEMYFYNTKDFTESKFTLPEHSCKQVIIEKERLFILTEEKIFIYQLNNL
ncbi:MAG: hypothetical protein PF485_00720 [Bacteroidales bacterium]|jgi:hypothetical protein|nr:hypothetical protein [Bacteroidales bacterium]